MDEIILNTVATNSKEWLGKKYDINSDYGSPYGLSKACTNAYTIFLAKQNPNLKINSCTPGFIETDMTRHMAIYGGKTTAELGMKSPEQGASASVFLLIDNSVGSGYYYGSDCLRSPLDKYRSPGDPPYTGNWIVSSIKSASFFLRKKDSLNIKTISN